MSDIKHTPTPWRTDEDFDHLSVAGADGAQIADCCILGFKVKRNDAINRANAAFIVRAVNAHDDLVDALEVAKQFVEQEAEMRGDADKGYALSCAAILPVIRAALAKASAQKNESTDTPDKREARVVP